ncbi:MAG: Mu-like prophage major head subunit gpT family protein [Lachnospiraceae bacterium]|nr:Mu-like prophage major head subunit gpT family protein [Lachnospiraceae bacterium]
MITPTAQNTHISTDWAKLLEPGLRAVFYNTYNELPTQFDKIFKMKSSSKASEKELGMGAFTPWVERINDTDNVDYQKIGQGLERNYTHKEFASGFAVGKRLYEDEQYGIINGMAEDLGRAGRTKVEVDAAEVLNNAFTTNMYDNKPLISADHPYEGGLAGVQSNLIEGALSDTKLKEAITKMRDLKDNGGKKIVLTPDVLVVPPQLEWLALELTKSTLKPGTADNDINTLAGRLKVFVYDYLTDSDAWFLLDSKRHKLTFFWRIKPEFTRGKDTDNFVAKYNGRMRYSYGASAWQGVIGSSGV